MLPGDRRMQIYRTQVWHILQVWVPADRANALPQIGEDAVRAAFPSVSPRATPIAR